MSTTPKQFVATAYLTTTSAALYTVPANTTAVIKQISVHNASASPVQITLNAVPSGGSVSTGNQKTKKTIAALQSLQLNEWVNRTLPTGAAIYGLAGSNSAVTIDVSGNEVT